MTESGLAINAGFVELYAPPEMLAQGPIERTLAKNIGRGAEGERDNGRC